MTGNNCVSVQQLDVAEKAADVLWFPMKWCINYVDIVISHAQYGSTRLTNPWNWSRLSPEDVSHLDVNDMLFFEGDQNVKPEVYPFLRSVAGSWKQFQVIASSEAVPWHVGWISGEHAGVSRIVLNGAVKVLIGPGDVYFFGVDAQTKSLTPIINTGSGDRMHEGAYAHLPLV